MGVRLSRAAVLGAGTMGSQIAAALAGAGLTVDLLDLGPGDLARSSLERLSSRRPSPFHDPADVRRIRPGSLEDDLAAAVGRADWVLEAVVEELQAKQTIWTRVSRAGPRPGAWLSTNTSGLSVARLAAGLGEEARRTFFGCHFFNPVRVLPLVELIPGPDTDGAVVDGVTRFLSDRLGKEPLVVPDRANFLANRLGVFVLQAGLRAMRRLGLTACELDAVTGRAMGRPASATCRTIDLIGMPVYLQVLRTGRLGAASPAERGMLRAFPGAARVVSEGLPFHRVRGGVREQLDLASLRYRPAEEAPEEVAAAAATGDPVERLRRLLALQGRFGSCARAVLRDCLAFCTAVVGEGVDPEAVDTALRLGFGWEVGPFEAWRALGLEPLGTRLGIPVPEAVRRPHPVSVGRRGAGEGAPVEAREVWSSAGGRLLDMGGGVACLELSGAKSTLGESSCEVVRRACDDVEDGDGWLGLVLSSADRHFSVGLDLGEVLRRVEDGEWSRLEAVLAHLQEACARLRGLTKPVVAAAWGYALGGGAELLLHTTRVEAHADLRVGLVETRAGLLPAGGGCAALLGRLGVSGAFGLIQGAWRSESAAGAVRRGLLRPWDHAVPRRDRVPACAAEAVRFLSRVGHVPPAPWDVRAAGPDGAAALLVPVLQAVAAGRAEPHDRVVAEEVASVLTGGGAPAGAPLEEDVVRRLEREAFLRLARRPETQARVRALVGPASRKEASPRAV